MILTIEEKQFESGEITQLYPAAIVKTGYRQETTQVSLEWLEREAKGKVEVVGFAILLYLGTADHHIFMFDTKEEMDSEIEKIAAQL